MNTTWESKDIEHEIKEYKNEYGSKQYSHLSTGLRSTVTIMIISLCLFVISLIKCCRNKQAKTKKLSKSIVEIENK